MKRIQLEIILGIVATLVTSFIIILYGLNETERMEEYTLAAEARQIEAGAALFETYCSRCHGTQGLGIPGLCPPLNDRYFFDNRLKEVGWSGSMNDYIIATASSGRVASTRPQEYPGQGVPAMPSFSDEFGGPLRTDQIESIAAFVVNWNAAAQEVSPPPTPSGPVVGTDITKELPEGDATAGETLATSLGCTACHITTQTGPAWLASGAQPGIGTRAETRFTETGYTGNAKSPEQYLFESIVSTNIHIVPGFTAGIMPQTYANQLTDQDMANLIAYLLSLK
jgi:mono/diheme cytochrome c family protein